MNVSTIPALPLVTGMIWTQYSYRKLTKGRKRRCNRGPKDDALAITRDERGTVSFCHRCGFTSADRRIKALTARTCQLLASLPIPLDPAPPRLPAVDHSRV